MSRYAERTEVSSDKSKAEIERTLSRYGATAFMYGWDQDRALIGFRMGERQIKFLLPLPSQEAYRFTPERRLRRTNDQMREAWEQATRQRWRALSLVIKAKLEAVEAGITTFEDEFLAYTMLPDGRTVGDWAQPQLTAAYQSGQMPALLPGPREE